MIGNFQDRLMQHLLAVCRDAGYLDGVLLTSPDIDAAWERLAPDYFGDAVKEFNGYPEYTLACAGFLGMAAAHLWDSDLERFQRAAYADFLGPRGFDDMDDFITGTILRDPKVDADASLSGDAGVVATASLPGGAAAAAASLPGVAAMQTCAGEAYHFLMRENVEPGTADAYRQFVVSAEAMFRLGAAIELHRLGYTLVPLQPSAPALPS